MEKLDKHSISKLSRGLPIEKVADYYQLDTTRAGNSKLKCCCCFHSEDTPSLVLYTETNSFYCYGCGVSGDSFQFIREYEEKVNNSNYSKALEILLELSDIQISQDKLQDVLDSLLLEGENDHSKELDSLHYYTGVQLREYLKSYKNTETYRSKCDQVDSILKGVDDLYSKGITLEKAKELYQTIQEKYRVR